MPREILFLPPGHLASVWLMPPGQSRLKVGHRHEELEFNLAVQGQARYAVASKRYDLVPGTLIWLYPDDEHVIFEESKDFVMWVVVFRPSLIWQSCKQPQHQPLRKRKPTRPICRDLDAEASSQLVSLMRQLASLDESEAEQLNFGATYLLLRTWWLFNQATQMTRQQTLHPAIAKVHRLLSQWQAGEHDELTLAQLAKHCDLSPTHLSRLFKQQSGQSLAAFRNQIRLKRYLAIMEDHRGAMTILDAALASGFGSYPQFHRVFRRLMGCSPAEHLAGHLAGYLAGQVVSKGSTGRRRDHLSRQSKDRVR